ncbi:MAG: inverse autotransporter beta domain-containing protein, partial [Puniceicoccales bacterium]
FVSDRAFDFLPEETTPNEGAIGTVDEIAPPTAATSEGSLLPAPEGADELFPTYVAPNSPKSASTLSPQTTPGTEALIETNQPGATEEEVVAVTSADEIVPAPDATDPGTASKTPPNTEDELVFPLTLAIPGYDPDAIPTQVIPEDEITADPGSMDYRNQGAPNDPLLQLSSPSVIGVGATLAGSESDVYLDALVPFWQSQSDYIHTIAFLVPRIATTEDVMTTGSLGLGVRSLHGEGSFMGGDFPWIVGANVFYDFTHSTNNYDYNQFGAGLEWMSPFLDLRVNGYLPESTENKVDETSSTSTSTSSSTTSSTSYGSLYASGHNVYQPFTTTTTTNFQRTTTTQFFEQYERALKGFDGEAGILVPEKYTLFPIRFYGGFYSFENPYGDDLTGPKARIEARPFSFLLLDASWYQDEELLGSNWFLGARASMTIGGGPTPPESSKPLHDTTEGPKTEVYNPYASFQSRLVERIPRNYQAVLTISPFLENLDRRQVSVSYYSTSSETTGQITIASRLIFVDGSRGSLTGAGTWQSPLSTIQGGADLAIANLGSSGQIWTVWTQGGVGTYTEDITVTGSVHFTSSSLPITGRNGQTFGGTGDGPIVDGGFLFGSLPANAASPTIPVGSVQGYEITGGHSAASFAGITFVNVEVAKASYNRIDTIGGTGIEVINTGTTSTSGT